MPAISYGRKQYLDYNVRQLFNRVCHYRKHNLTSQDMIQTFVKDEDRDLCLRATELFRLSAGGSFAAPWIEPETGTKVMLTVNVKQYGNGVKPFMIPHYTGKEVFNRDPEIMAKINSWVTWRVKAAREWGLVQAVLDSLVDKCKTTAQMRYFWEGTLALHAMSPELDEHTDKIRDWQAIANVPQLPPLLKTALRETETTLAKAMLLEKVEETPQTWDQQIGLALGVDTPLAKVPWTGLRMVRF